MNKLIMAHEYAMKHVQEGFDINYDVLVVEAWKYADAMQAEADKRVVKLPDVFFDTKTNEEWQPDWSQAPMGFNRFVVGSDGGYGFFTNMEPQLQDDFWFVGADGIVIKDHGYRGNWQDSLRKRPQ